MFTKPYWIQSVKINPDGSKLVTVEYLHKQTGVPAQSLPTGIGFSPRVAPYTAATISAAAADNSINDSAAGFPALLPGDNIVITGFTGTVANNQRAVVVSATASKIVLATAVPLVNDAAGESVTVTMASLLSATSENPSDTTDFLEVDLLIAPGSLTIDPDYCKNEFFVERS